MVYFIFSKMIKARCSVCSKITGFYFAIWTYGTIWQTFDTMFSGSDSLENASRLEYLLGSWLPKKISQLTFVLSARGPFSFPTRMLIYKWSPGLSAPRISIEITYSLRYVSSDKLTLNLIHYPKTGLFLIKFWTLSKLSDDRLNEFL